MDKHYAFLSLISWICLSIGATFIYVIYGSFIVYSNFIITFALVNNIKEVE